MTDREDVIQSIMMMLEYPDEHMVDGKWEKKSDGSFGPNVKASVTHTSKHIPRDSYKKEIKKIKVRNQQYRMTRTRQLTMHTDYAQAVGCLRWDC